MNYTKIIKHQDKAYIYYSKDSKILRFPTGVDIKKSDLDSKGKLKANFEKNNEIVQSIRQNIENFVREFIKNNLYKPEIADITNFIKNNQSKNKEKHNLFIILFNEFFEEIKLTVNKSTISTYNSFKISILNWELYNKKKLLISDIDKKWNESYIDFLKIDHQQLKKEGVKLIGHSLGKLENSTIERRFITLKMFYKWLANKEIIPFPKCLSDFKISVENPRKEYISIQDIHSLYEVNLTDKPDEEKVRDMFIFSCLTGLRWSDLVRVYKLNFETYNKQRVIIDYNKKTKTKIIIPLHSICEEILSKYNQDFNVEDNYNQVFNVILKKICKKSNLFSKRAKTEKQDKDGNKYIKADKISIHSGRHSFITNLVNSSIPISAIMLMTGHTKIETLQMYLHIPDRLDPSIINVFNKI